MPECKFPGCPRNSDGSSTYCVFHKKHYSNVAEVKIKKPPPKETNDMKAVKRDLKKLYPIYLAKNPLCNIKSPVCTGKATCVNHTEGRGGNTLEITTWEASCVPCNQYIEENHEWARQRGHKKQRHT